MRLAPKAGEISESREQGALDAFECLTLSGALMVHSIDLCDDEMLADHAYDVPTSNEAINRMFRNTIYWN